MAKVTKIVVEYAFKKGLNFNSAEVRLSQQIELEEGDDAKKIRRFYYKVLKNEVMARIAEVQEEYEKAQGPSSDKPFNKFKIETDDERLEKQNRKNKKRSNKIRST